MHRTNSGEAASYRFSVIVPTYQRRSLVVSLVQSLAGQEFNGRFEVIVVVDGSTDSSAAALRQLDTPFPLTVLEQANRGAAAARNRGADVACGELLLFLDDDMEADRRLLAEHDRSHHEGADVVLGHIPLHPSSPVNILSAAVGSWAEERGRILSSPGARLTLHDLLTGQLSLSRETFRHCRGFDANFTRGGAFGNEDIDFGYRLLSEGYRIVFNPKAISWQKYVVGPREHLRQWRQAGRADVAFARKHPEQAEAIFALNGSNLWMNRRVWGPLSRLPILAGPLTALLRRLAIAVVERRIEYPAAARFFFQVRAVEYWRGVQEVGGVPRPRAVRVLAYHAIRDLKEARVIGPYAVRTDSFRRHLRLLHRAGFHFISADEFIEFLTAGGGLPRRPVLLTFDDGYEELLTDVLPVLEEQRIPAVTFVVSWRVGGTNDWDEAIGAPRLRLLDLASLRTLAQSGVEIGAHSRTHRPLSALSDQALFEETAGSIEDLERAGLDRPRLYAYPEGEYDERVVQAVQAAGIQVAFTVIPGRVEAGADPYQIPRIEILRADTGWKFLWKVYRAGLSQAKLRLKDTGKKAGMMATGQVDVAAKSLQHR
jgi:peptidoglycan/xylan/chitin deacetylase (PgdA/CDA1 family)/GT2 family glycosyltransferase